MKIYLKIIIIIHLVFVSCNNKENSELLIIPVDSSEEVTPPLSEIADEIEAVELELTDESLISSISQVLIGDDYIVVSDNKSEQKIMLFDRNGQFIRQIGSKGQGPSEFTYISGITIDEKNKQLYVQNNNNKILCYTFDGQFIKKSTKKQLYPIKQILYSEEELLLISENNSLRDSVGLYNQCVLYNLNNGLQITDSVEIRKEYSNVVIFSYESEIDYMTRDNKNTYLYYHDINNGSTKKAPKPVIRDTLYQLKKNQLIPCLRLKFKDEGFDSNGIKIIDIYNMYKSSRFVFSYYHHALKKENRYFCYDTKTQKGYNMKDGYTDDIHNLPKKVTIRPFASDAERFYYTYTNMDNMVGLEEPNPTLYIGKLKK